MPAKWVQVPGKTTKKRPLKTLLKIQKKHIDMFDVIFQETLWIVAMRKQAKYASAGVIWVPSSVPCWKYTTDLCHCESL